MIIYYNNQRYGSWSIGDPCPRCKFKDVFIAIDPSKTNFAIMVGDPFGQPLECIEFTGNNRTKGPVMDTSQYCAEVKEFLELYFSETNVLRLGLEKAISKKGMNWHTSSMTLTEIRAVVLNWANTTLGFTTHDVEIPNWTWKSHVLPQGYRSQSEKGSKRWLANTWLGNFYEADMTDAYCIYLYMVQEYGGDYVWRCSRKEELLPNLEVNYTLTESPHMTGREFEYNPAFSLQDNIIFAKNRNMNGVSVTTVLVEYLDYKDIYGHTTLIESECPECVRLVVV